MTLSPWILAYLAFGAGAGFFAGLLGIGGGVVLVPLLSMAFREQAGFPADECLHLALGTSMACIIFTAIASLRTHHRRDAVLWPVVRQITPGIVLGALLGTRLAAELPGQWLGIFFSLFIVAIAIQMLVNFKPAAGRNLPGKFGLFMTGNGIGAFSALAAIGGGTLIVPFLSWCNVRLPQAIGTSAAIGLPIALGGSLGYIINGWGNTGLPVGSFGFIYLPALLLLIIGSMSTAPFGARLAHRLPIRTLQKIFAALLFLLAAKMLADLL